MHGLHSVNSAVLLIYTLLYCYTVVSLELSSRDWAACIQWISFARSCLMRNYVVLWYRLHCV